MNKFALFLLTAAALVAGAAQAVTVRGHGTGSLVGHDLTDPENDGHSQEYVNYNAVFRSSIEPQYAAEGAFNVFDNIVGAGNDKWCCDANGWVEADFGSKRYQLTSFTASSANDAAERDSDIWQILGSNDGLNYTTIFSYNNNGVSPWRNRLQVNEYTAGVDYTLPAAYSIFRYQTFSTIGNGLHQLAELEFFGKELVEEANDVPEPGSIALLGLGLLVGVGAGRRKRA